jgi:hypothetical protein
MQEKKTISYPSLYSQELVVNYVLPLVFSVELSILGSSLRLKGTVHHGRENRPCL